ncbi:MAG: hypothetical protein K0Q57_976 [Gammaproteobacteria bacterium]|nr:hypothetical protein [Gammaproteobacteria bacterium]
MDHLESIGEGFEAIGEAAEEVGAHGANNQGGSCCGIMLGGVLSAGILTLCWYFGYLVQENIDKDSRDCAWYEANHCTNEAAQEKNCTAISEDLPHCSTNLTGPILTVILGGLACLLILCYKKDCCNSQNPNPRQATVLAPTETRAQPTEATPLTESKQPA